MRIDNRAETSRVNRSLPDDVQPGRQWWKRAWAWGLLITVGLGIASAVGNSARWQLTIVVSLAALGLTASVEMYLETERNTTELRNTRRRMSVLEQTALRLSPLVAAPASFQRFAENIASNTQEIESNGHAFFQVILDKMQHQFQQATADIAAERIEIDANAPYSFRSATFDKFRVMRMVHVRGLDFWESRRGESYLERQRVAVEARALSIERIFVIAPSQKDRAKVIVANQVRAGIRAHVIVNDSQVDREIARDAIDMGIVEDTDGALMVVRLGQEGATLGFFNADREVISHRPVDIENAVAQFERLLGNAKPAAEVFRELSAP